MAFKDGRKEERKKERKKEKQGKKATNEITLKNCHLPAICMLQVR